MKRFFGEKEFQCGICGDVMDSDDSTIGHIARDHRVLGMKN
jgi:5-methylcytosine-specific restriction endonuclease McrA